MTRNSFEARSSGNSPASAGTIEVRTLVFQHTPGGINGAGRLLMPSAMPAP